MWCVNAEAVVTDSASPVMPAFVADTDTNTAAASPVDVDVIVDAVLTWADTAGNHVSTTQPGRTRQLSSHEGVKLVAKLVSLRPIPALFQPRQLSR